MHSPTCLLSYILSVCALCVLSLAPTRPSPRVLYCSGVGDSWSWRDITTTPRKVRGGHRETSHAPFGPCSRLEQCCLARFGRRGERAGLRRLVPAQGSPPAAQRFVGGRHAREWDVAPLRPRAAAPPRGPLWPPFWAPRGPIPAEIGALMGLGCAPGARVAAAPCPPVAALRGCARRPRSAPNTPPSGPRGALLGPVRKGRGLPGGRAAAAVPSPPWGFWKPHAGRWTASTAHTMPRGLRLHHGLSNPW
eukprot:scaffold377_cov563-Prasinococcus_capsulatus_cf.AAC.17